MHRLILTRHAKSDWHTDAPDDFSRPLNARGRRSAKALGQWMRDHQLTPEQTLCSPALRTRETLERMELDTRTDYAQELYDAPADTILSVIRRAQSPSLLLLAHNPGLQSLAHALVRHAPPHSRFEDYPTGATLVMDFAIPDWSALMPASGKVLDFIVPRELLGE